MKFNLKEQQKQKTKQYFKNNSFILFAINANQKAQNWVSTEQELKKLQFDYYKICNKTTKKVILKSENLRFTNIINSTFFLLKPTTKTTKLNLKTFQQLESIFFTILAIRLNKNAYTIAQSKNITSLYYKKNVSILYQSLLTNLKKVYSIKK